MARALDDLIAQVAARPMRFCRAVLRVASVPELRITTAHNAE